MHSIKIWLIWVTDYFNRTHIWEWMQYKPHMPFAMREWRSQMQRHDRPCPPHLSSFGLAPIMRGHQARYRTCIHQRDISWSNLITLLFTKIQVSLDKVSPIRHGRTKSFEMVSRRGRRPIKEGTKLSLSESSSLGRHNMYMMASQVFPFCSSWR